MVIVSVVAVRNVIGIIVFILAMFVVIILLIVVSLLVKTAVLAL